MSSAASPVDDSYRRDDFWVTTSNKQLNFVQHIYRLLPLVAAPGKPCSNA
jgi:hypothetical protein